MRNGFDLKPIDEDPAPDVPVPDPDDAARVLGEFAPEVLGLNAAFIRRVLTKLGRPEDPRKMSVGSFHAVYDLVKPAPTLTVPYHFTKAGVNDLVELTTLDAAADGADGAEGPVRHCSALRLPGKLGASSVQTVVTSPPYWGNRLYREMPADRWSDGTTCVFGAESSPEAYVRHTLEILHRLRRVLTETSTVWWNVGDSYNTRTQIRTSSAERLKAMREGDDVTWTGHAARRHSAGHPYLKDKDLSLIPQWIAIGAERIGYWCRSWITWDKENAMPETVQDRPTTSHEPILLLSRSKVYKFHRDAWKGIRVPKEYAESVPADGSANLRTVWRFPTSSGRGIHGAQFPMALPLRCIALSTDPGDVVLDPFAGSGTTGVAAKVLGRRFAGSDVVGDYVAHANARIQGTALPSSLDAFEVGPVPSR